MQLPCQFKHEENHEDGKGDPCYSAPFKYELEAVEGSPVTELVPMLVERPGALAEAE